MEEIFHLVRERIEAQGHLKRLGGGVVIVGGGALLPGIVELASEIFELPVRIGTPQGSGGLIAEYSSPVYATAAGLVMSAAKKEEGQELHIARKEHGQNIFTKVKDWLKEFF
jgi:cell division protein FtsA